MTAPTKPAPVWRQDVAPAPHLTKHGRCSDCNTTAVVAASGEMKVCPHCFGVLWKRDYEQEERRRKQEAAIDAARIFATTKTREE